MSHHYWTQADVRLLRRLHAKGVGLDVIAQQIGSTPGSVSQACTKLGLHRGGVACRYCDAALRHASVGRKKRYCDALCAQTHSAEIDHQRRRAEFYARKPICRHCDTPLRAFQQKYCSRRCGQAAWHRSVWDDPARKLRRSAMLQRNKLDRKARVSATS